ncbi:MAG: helix-turn-helix domain-containing protein, partial [Dehalococcoidia bacterium]|nr:helix-turn-helix domain-containing protein [Dehalococcoidia bacterium]
FLYAGARNIVRTYWRKKYRERRRFCRLYEGDKGEMVADGWKLVSYDPDIAGKIDARATLNTLPERMVKAGIIRDEGGKLNNADKLYLCRQRHRQSKYNWSDAEKIERMRQLYVDEGLPCTEVAKIVGKGRSTVQRQLNKLGVMRGR